MCKDTQVYSEDGTKCEDCPAFTRAQNNNSKCEADVCTVNQIIIKDGTCQMCAPDLYPDETWRKC